MFEVMVDCCKPVKGTKHSACIDLFASEDVSIGAGETKLVGLGVKIDMEKLEEMANKLWGSRRNPHHFKHFLNSHYLQLEPRSSLRVKGLVAGTGIIDLDYPDEIKLVLHAPIVNVDCIEDTLWGGRLIKKGEKIAQIMLCEHKTWLFDIETNEERVGGFGSTTKDEK